MLRANNLSASYLLIDSQVTKKTMTLEDTNRLGFETL